MVLALPALQRNNNCTISICSIIKKPTSSGGTLSRLRPPTRIPLTPCSNSPQITELNSNRQPQSLEVLKIFFHSFSQEAELGPLVPYQIKALQGAACHSFSCSQVEPKRSSTSDPHALSASYKSDSSPSTVKVNGYTFTWHSFLTTANFKVVIPD